MPQEQNVKRAAPSTVQGTGAGISPGATRQTGRPAAGGAESAAISEELVRKVADRVYSLLLAELRLDDERLRSAGIRAGRRGGW